MGVRGRVEMVSDKRWVVAELEKMEAGNSFLTYYMLNNLIEAGYVTPVFVKVDPKARGRKTKMYKVSAKGKTLIRFSKNWKPKGVAPFQPEAVAA